MGVIKGDTRSLDDSSPDPRDLSSPMLVIFLDLRAQCRIILYTLTWIPRVKSLRFPGFAGMLTMPLKGVSPAGAAFGRFWGVCIRGTFYRVDNFFL